MAVDMFLKLDAIKGESADSKHKDWIEVLSYSWGVSNPNHATDPAGSGQGRSEFQDFHFSSRTQKSSPQLFLHCATGEHIKEATITTRKATGKEVDYLVIKMTDCLVSSYEMDANGGGRSSYPLDQVSMNFAKFQIDYKELNAKGSVVGTSSASYDLKQNT